LAGSIVELRTPRGVRLDCRLADGFLSRFLGLMGRRELRNGAALLLVPGGSVHTFFVRFPLDVAFLDPEGTTLRVAPHVRPWRLARAPRGARFVLELGAGQAAASGLEEGARLELDGGGWERLARRRRLF
jgi:uncharacterized membrane protein (UPF0127 family)